MQKFIPKEKCSKKTQRELNLAKRGSWGSINPVTRKPANPKAYNRKKLQRGDEIHQVEAFHFICFLFYCTTAWN
ncbi:hypothetical protein V6615_06010 [Oscillospiraceae bacterium PP1C4]